MRNCIDYKLSIFNRYLNKNGDLCIYNINNNAAIIIENTTIEYFKNNYLVRDDLKEMMELGMVVNYDEIAENETNHQSIIMDTKNLMLNIVTTYKCNCNCAYCFEKGNIPAKHQNNSLDKLIEYINQLLKKCGSESLYLNYFGGEPLINIDKVCLLNKYYINRVNLYSQVTTNGTLLNATNVKKLVASGVKRYQITIDGDRTTHNIRRPLKNNESSWDRTVEGIINLLDYEADITIRINVDENNVNEFKEIFLGLPDKIINSKNISFDLMPVIGQKGTNYLEKKKEVMIKAWNIIKDNDLPISIILPKFAPCSYSSAVNAFYIDLDGNIYACGSHVGDKSKVEGSYSDRNEVYYNRINRKIMDKCYSCEFFYECMGGCNYELESNNIICQKDYFQSLYDYYYLNYIF